jgi:hypothetical protein
MSSNYENVGIAFVSFKDKNCVTDTIEEMDLVKTKLVGKKHYDALEIKNWEVEMAYPTNDIIWAELGNRVNRSFPTKVLLNLFILFLSVIVILSIVLLD